MSRLTKKVYATVYKGLQWVGALLLHANLFDKGKQKQKEKKRTEQLYQKIDLTMTNAWCCYHKVWRIRISFITYMMIGSSEHAGIIKKRNLERFEWCGAHPGMLFHVIKEVPISSVLIPSPQCLLLGEGDFHIPQNRLFLPLVLWPSIGQTQHVGTFFRVLGIFQFVIFFI